MTDIELKEAIKNYCDQNERSTSYVAKKCGISVGHFCNFLHNRRNLSPELKKRIEDFLAGGN